MPDPIPHFRVASSAAARPACRPAIISSARGIEHVVFEKNRAHAQMARRALGRASASSRRTGSASCPATLIAGADPHGFMVKDEILDYLDGFRAQGRRAAARRRRGRTRFAPPGRRLRRADVRGRIRADAVVLATSGYRRADRAALCRAHAQIDRPDPFRALSQSAGPAGGRGRGRRLRTVGRADRRGPASRRPQGASGGRRRAALRALLSRPRRRRLAWDMG